MKSEMYCVIDLFYRTYFCGKSVSDLIIEQNNWLDKTGIVNHRDIVDFYREMRKCLK